MIPNQSKKHCSICHSVMQRRGKTVIGSQRWHCHTCNQSATRKRQDNRVRTRLSLFVNWLTGTVSISKIALRYKVSERTVNRWFVPRL